MDAQTVERFGWASDREVLIAEELYRHVDDSDVAEREPVGITGPVHLLTDLAGQRDEAVACVHVGNHAWNPRSSVVAVVNDDMPFLVDSVTAELTRLGIGIHLVAHPILSVTRDAGGVLRSVQRSTPPGRAAPPDARDESWIYLEVDRQTDPQAHGTVADELRRILDDVRRAVLDWPAMVRVARNLAGELTTTPPRGIPTEELRGAVDLLRWLAADQFTFLGYRRYRLVESSPAPSGIVDVPVPPAREAVLSPTRPGAGALPSPGGTAPSRAATPGAPPADTRGDGWSLVSEPGSGLGLLRSGGPVSVAFADLPPAVRIRALEPRLLIVTKANRRSTVHRPVHLDYIGIKIFDRTGLVIGEHRFIGLFAAPAYTQSVATVPVIDRKVRRVRRALGLETGSHTGRDLMTFLETFPRDELFAIALPDLIAIADAALNLKERRAARLFVWHDTYRRFLSCLIYVPRDRYTTDVRLRLQQEVMAAVGGESVEFTARVTESVLARLHLVVRVPRRESVPPVDVPALEARIASLARSWEDELVLHLAQHTSHEGVAELLRAYPEGFPAAYKASTPPAEAVRDLVEMGRLGPTQPLVVTLQPVSADSGAAANARLRLYAMSDISLAQVLPVLAALGSSVVTEHPFRLVRRPDAGSGEGRFVYDFGLAVDPGIDLAQRRSDWEAAFLACWQGRAEVDGLNGLVATAGLTWQEVSILRTYARYLRQIRGVYSPEYIEGALLAYPRIAALLVDLFAERFEPERVERGSVAQGDRVRRELDTLLTAVVSLDHDRILRLIRDLIRATLRTNHYRPDRGAMAIKLAPHLVREIPVPRPQFEVWVCSPHVEGVHLRFGSVARGGIRWSDRREDFRTEILGLARAQLVKNALIVPGGAKGGFVVKRPPDAGADRAAWQAEGVAAYRSFIAAMLDLTDNLVGDVVVGPLGVVRRDDADPYLVVAADKGTATFSDVANAIAIERGFWLGDAFASGGSAGYDHKEMGITARGAWESVRAHFHHLGRDADSEALVVVGIGDMSGDVFGNGMLRSANLRLVAAFDHRHVFLDPDPDPAVSFAERQRLFALPRSSWADYDPALISEGGGVYPRSAKAIPISEQVAGVLGIEPGGPGLTPAEVVRAILTADVDLLWNGGVGTFVKASSETNMVVGDRANDSVRVDARQLRVKVVAEGGNLGITQSGRIEAARAGVLLNTDAIDNSAGVDCSDHEVNIKIVLESLVRSGRITAEERNALLVEMTDEVAELVLRDNRAQTLALMIARTQSLMMVNVHARYLDTLEAEGWLDRRLEFLPTDKQIAERQSAGSGLRAPEFAVMIAYTKNADVTEILESDLPDDTALDVDLLAYFPTVLRERFPDAIREHRLRREIVATRVVNSMVNLAGISFDHRMTEDSGASVSDVARAFVAAREIFGFAEIWDEIDALGSSVSAADQIELFLDARRMAERGAGWLLRNRRPPLAIGDAVDTFGAGLAFLAESLDSVVTGRVGDDIERLRSRWEEAGVPAPLAVRAARFPWMHTGFDIVEIAHREATNVADAATAYWSVFDAFDLGWLWDGIGRLPRSDRWQTQARSALRDDLMTTLADLTRLVMDKAGGSPAAWIAANERAVGRALAMHTEIRRADSFDLTTLSVALRQLRNLTLTAVAPKPQ